VIHFGPDDEQAPVTQTLTAQWPATVAAVSQPSAAQPRVTKSWDATMVDRVAAGDETALATLYDQHVGLLYSLALRVTRDRTAAEDVVQEVFVHVWTHPLTFDETRGSLRSWLGVIAHRRAVDRVRREAAARAREERDHRRTVTAPPDIAEAAATLITSERVREAVRRLPADQRQAIELAYFDGRTFREVAAVLEIAEGTAKSRIRLGLSKLSDALQGVTSWT
jgi:RNA polymerase sigma factor (sigma-70 family)